MKAITTKQLSRTDTKPARIKAFDGDKNSVTICEDSCKEIAHIEAAKKLAAKMNWKGCLATGWTKSGEYVHVWISDETKTDIV